MQDKGLYLSDIAKQELDVYTKAIRDIIEKTFLYCKNTDYEKSREIEPLEEVIDVLSEELKTDIYKDL